jgi:GT2 family glycosyltransferase
MIKVSVIILCYQGDQWIDACVQSLENQSLDRDFYEILLVDNGGSTPSLRNYVNKPNITVLFFEKNWGFAEGNNRALMHTRSDLVILLNQDVVAHYHFLEEMLKALSHCPKAGIISANMQMVSRRESIDLFTPLPSLVGLYRLTRTGYASYSLIETSRSLFPVNFVSGNGLGFKKAILKDVGNFLFDPRLGSYAEDLDLSIRMSNTPWRMFICTNAIIYHFRDDAFTGSPASMLRKFINVSSNRLLVYYNNLEFHRFLLKLPLLIMGVPLKVSRHDGMSEVYRLRFIAGILALPLVGLSFLSKIVIHR